MSDGGAMIWFAFGMSWLALAVVLGVVLYLIIDYRESKIAGEIMERARQTLAPPEWPRRS